MTVNKLKKLEKVIKPILEECPQARNDDFILYAKVIKEYDPELLEVSAKRFLISHNALGVPNLKSIERVRRKLQEKYPELESDRAKEKRAKEEQAYYNYAINKNQEKSN